MGGERGEGRQGRLFCGVDDGIGPDDLKTSEVAPIHQLCVEHALNVVHPLCRLCHVQTHREWVKVVIHVPAMEGEDRCNGGGEQV